MGGDLRGFGLPVLPPAPTSWRAHESLLADIDKASGGKTVWRPAAARPMA
jgi:DNA polymerase-3 subunit epsilon